MSMMDDLMSQGFRLPSYATGNYKTTCPRCSHDRKNKSDPCMSVTIADGAALYNCHNCYWSGRAGPVTNRPAENLPKEYKAPAPDKVQVGKLSDAAIKWLKETRHITRAVWERNRIYSEGGTLYFPYYYEGKLVNIKSRAMETKRFSFTQGAELIFYGLDDVKGEEELYIVEGELDKLALEVCGYKNVISVPNGAPAKIREGDVTENTGLFHYLMHAEAIIKNAKKVLLAVDNDKAGKNLQYELARRIGAEKCYIVEFPTKDANDCLIELGVDLVIDCVNSAKPYPINGLYTVMDFGKSLIEYFNHNMQKGASTGWPNLDQLYTIVPGRITVITGVPGSGKSEAIDALMWNLAKYSEWKFAIFSPENGKEAHVTKLVEKVIEKSTNPKAKNRMTEQEFSDGALTVSKFFYFIVAEDMDTLPTLDWILEKAKVAVYRYGIRGLVIDPYNEIEHQRGPGMQETEYISKMLSRLKKFAQTYGLHIWIVAHPTKMTKDKEGKISVPSLYDISGCYSDDTEVLTEKGWKLHSQVSLLDKVCCFDPEKNTLSYESPSKVHKYPYKGEMHLYHGYSLDMLVTPNHRMLVQAAWKRPGKKIGNDNLGRPDTWSHEGWQFAESQALKTAKYRMPMAAPKQEAALESYDLPYPAEAFWGYIGWYVSEGWRAMNAPAVCQAEENHIRVRNVLVALGLPFSDSYTHYNKQEKPMWSARIKRRGNEIFCDWIFEHCKYGSMNVKLPDITWTTNSNLKRILFDALMDGDGHRRKTGGYQYATISKQLADDVQRLAIELGMYATVSSQAPTKPHHHARYRVIIGPERRTQRVIVLPRNRSVVPYEGTVYCLTVPTGAYITRRNGMMAICGNSSNWVNKTDFGIVIHRCEGVANITEVHVNKVRFKHEGSRGCCSLIYNKETGIYTASEETKKAIYAESDDDIITFEA